MRNQKRVSGNQPLLSKFLYGKAWLHGTRQLSQETPTGSSEQSKNIERLRVNKVSGQFFSQKFVRCHVNAAWEWCLLQTTIVSSCHVTKLFLYVSISCSCIFIKIKFYCHVRPLKLFCLVSNCSFPNLRFWHLNLTFAAPGECDSKSLRCVYILL